MAAATWVVMWGFGLPASTNLLSVPVSVIGQRSGVYA